MTTAANIKAGEAWVGIHGKMGNLPEVLEKARRQVGSFAGSVEQFGEHVGTKFGKTIMNGLVGFAAVSAIDNVLRSVADKMKTAMDSGAAFGFEEIGSAIGGAIMEGIRSLPIIGSLPDLGAMISDPLWGSPMATEAAMKRMEKQRASIMELFRDMNEMEQDALDAATGNTQIDRVRGIEGRIGSIRDKLLAAGVNDIGANGAAQGVMKAYRALFETESEGKINKVLDTFDQMTGVLDANAMAAKRLEEQLREIADLMTIAGRSKDEIDQTIGTLRSDFEYSRLTQEANERTKQIESLLESIERESKLFGKSQVQVLEYELKRLGATQEQMDRGLETALDLEDKQREAARRAEATTSIERSFGTFSQGAFDPRSVASNSVIGESTRETARNTRRMVSLLERNQLVYGA